MIRNVIIDFDGVFIPDEYRGFRPICDDEKVVEDLERKYYTQKNCSNFWNEIRSRFSLTNSDKELIDAYNFEDDEQHNHEQSIVGVLQTLSRSYNISLLSNQITDRTNYIRQKPYVSLFKKMYFSNEIGYAKPDEKIFNYVCEDLKCTPQECLFVDDSKENIVEAEIQLFNVYQFKNKQSFITYFSHSSRT